MIISNYVLLGKGGKHRLIHASKFEPAPADLANEGFYIIIWVGGRRIDIRIWAQNM